MSRFVIDDGIEIQAPDKFKVTDDNRAGVFYLKVREEINGSRIHGDQDKHVPVEHANIIAEAIRRGGNQDVTVQIFPGHDHIFIHGGRGHLVEEAKKMKKEKKSLNEIPQIYKCTDWRFIGINPLC